MMPSTTPLSLSGLLRMVLALGAMHLGLRSPISAAEPIILRSSLTPGSPWRGQRVILSIDVLAMDSWARIESFSDLEVPGAYVIQGARQGSRLQESIDGQSYTGQRYEWSIYPQRPGPLEVPALSVQVVNKTFGANATESSVQRTSPAVSVSCKAPPGTEHLRGLISTTHLSATQSWTPTPGDAHQVGDAIQRTIHLKATDMSGMAFTPMRHPPIEGVGLYPGEPTVQDTSNRGTITGSRTESVTYVFEQPGTITIPAVVLPWWNVNSETLEQILLPGETLTIIGPPTDSLASSPLNYANPRNPVWGWILISLTTLIALAILRSRRTLTLRWRAWQTERQSSEAAQFHRTLATIRTGDPQATLRDLMHWIDTITPGPEPARLDHFLQSHADVPTRSLANQLSHRHDTRPDLAPLASGLKRARRNWIQDQRHRSRARQASAHLPPLNLNLRSISYPRILNRIPMGTDPSSPSQNKPTAQTPNLL